MNPLIKWYDANHQYLILLNNMQVKKMWRWGLLPSHNARRGCGGYCNHFKMSANVSLNFMKVMLPLLCYHYYIMFFKGYLQACKMELISTNFKKTAKHFNSFFSITFYLSELELHILLEETKYNSTQTNNKLWYFLNHIIIIKEINDTFYWNTSMLVKFYIK